MEQPELDIVFMPLPPRIYSKRTGWPWETLLNPLREAPGCTARIKEHKTRQAADSQVRIIKKRLKEAVPMEKWEFTVRSMQDSSGTYGTFVTYRGIMTERERQEREIASKLHSQRTKKNIEAARLRKQLQGSASVTEINQVLRRSR